MPQQAATPYQHQAVADDEDLGTRARSSDFDANRRAPTGLKDIARAAGGPTMHFQANRGRGHARSCLWRVEASEEALVFEEEQLSIAASVVAADYQVSRAFVGLMW